MDMKLFLQIVANASGLKREVGESGNAVTRFTQGARREFAALRSSVGGLKGALAGIGLGVGAAQVLTQSAQLDKGLIRVRQTAGETAEMVNGLRQQFFIMSRETGTQVESLKEGFDGLIQSGQSWKAALESTKGINIASTVTGAQGKTLAGGLTVGATAFNIDLEKPGKALELLDKMTVAGRLGNAELENLSDIFARVGVNAASAGMGYDKTLAFIEGLSLVERQPERLATLADSTLRLFTNLKYTAAAQNGTGVKFFADDGSRRDPVAVLQDIKKRWDALKNDKQRAVFIQKAFGNADLDTIKGLRTLLSGDALGTVREFTQKIGNAGGTLQRDLPDAINNAADQAERLKANLRIAGDSFAQPINKALADMIQWTMASTKDGGLNLSGKEMLVGGGAIALGTMLTARYGGKAIGSLASRLLAKGGSTAIGVAEGRALQAAAGVTPVFVVNWPGSGVSMPGVPGGIPGGGGAGGAGGAAAGAAGSLFGGAAGKVKDWWRIAGSPVAKGASYLPMLATRLGFVGLAAGGGYLAGTGLNKGLGAIMGASTNGRYSGDGAIGELLYDILHGGVQSSRTQAKNNIQVDINFDALGRPFVRTNSMNTDVKTGGRRGSFFDALMTTKGM